jgi:hypothetical protein|tara:strand:- start:309 stop:482 length:174 start_codon:yes stop_codon:yes gene_type:complete
MKKYLIEFTLVNGSKEEVELVTDRLQWSIDQWSRNRAVSSHTILSESKNSSKQMLLG